jgi:negative regulator of flagellin synthesis FlgM
MNFDTTNNLGSISAKNAKTRVATPTADAKPGVASNAPAKTESSDQVVLSQEAQTLGRLQSKINASPDVNLDKVAEIKRAIAEGRFEINPERIAENMLKQDELLG